MIQKALAAPGWLTAGAVYQINPRTFSSEGTIAAVTGELPFLAELGIGTIYLCPIFKEDASENREYWSVRQKASQTDNPKNLYRMNNYFHIDEEYGTMEDLEACIRECHRLGMRLILDLVYYHIGPEDPILKTHPEFAKQNADGSFINGEWNFPVFDFNNPGLREYLYSNMIYYIAVLDADGFRCDIGDFLPQDFWAEGLKRICAVKPDACLILEGGNGQYLLNGFHAIYGNNWHNCIYNTITGKQTAAAIRECWTGMHNGYPDGARILRDIDNHDTVTDWPERVECLVGHTGMDLILALNCCIDGTPMVYCGNELCDTTELSMFANRFHPGRFAHTPREELKNTPQSRRRQQILHTLNHVRAEDAALRTGKMTWLEHNQADSVLAFVRTDGQRKVWFIGNLSNAETNVSLAGPGPEKNTKTLLACGAEQTDSCSFALQAYGFIVLRELPL